MKHNFIKKNFSIISNKLINEEKLSAGAKGVACYLLSKPENWQFYLIDIKSNMKDSLSAIKKYIKELEEIGFLKRTRTTKVINGRNKWVWDYDFSIDYIYYDANCMDANCMDANCMDANCMDANSSDIIILNKNNTKISNTKISNTKQSLQEGINKVDTHIYRDNNIDNNKEKEINKEKEKEINKEKEKEDDFDLILKEWYEYKKQRKESYKSNLSKDKLKQHLIKISNNNIEVAKEIIDQSIINNWQGLFELKKEEKKPFLKKEENIDDFIKSVCR